MTPPTLSNEKYRNWGRCNIFSYCATSLAIQSRSLYNTQTRRSICCRALESRLTLANLEPEMPTRRNVLKSALLSAGAVLTPLNGLPAFAAEETPPYNLDGFKTYAEYKRNRKWLGIAPDAVVPDPSNPSIECDGMRCMNCGRCDAACMEQKIAHWYKPEALKPSVKTLCMHCGQCVTACRHNVLHEKIDFVDVGIAMARSAKAADKSEKRVFVATTAPAIRVAFGELFGLAPGANLQGQIVAMLKKLGFDYVLDTTFGADLVTVEEAREFKERLDSKTPGPMFTSCCPAWVTFVETFYPEFIPNLSTTRSPILAQGAAIKTTFAKEKGIDPASVVNVAFVPCVGKKYEATRSENVAAAKFWKRDGAFRDLDYALTTRELGSWASYFQLTPNQLEPAEYDSTLGTGSGSGKIFGYTGGVLRALVRQFSQDVTGEAPSAAAMELSAVDGIAGLRETTVEVGNYKIRAAVVSGLADARELLDQIKSGRASYDVVEVMACPGGCVGGGGQPKIDGAERPTNEIRAQRAQGLKKIDQQETIRVASDNPEIAAFYQNFAGPSGDEQREALFHTTYQRQDVWK